MSLIQNSFVRRDDGESTDRHDIDKATFNLERFN